MKRHHVLPSLGACALLLSATVTSSDATAHPSATPAPSFSVSIPWGSAYGNVGLTAALPESPAQGPSSLAVLADGSTLILDRVNQRVVRLSPQGKASTPWTYVHLPETAEVLGASTNGNEWVAYSPLMARGWTYRGSLRTGSWTVPRVLPDLRSFSLDATSRVVGHASCQERFFFSSNGTRQTPLAQLLRTKKEGAYSAPNDAALSVRLLDDNRVQWLIYSGRSDHPASHATTRTFSIEAMSARLIGTSGDLGCMLVEQGRTNTTVVNTRASVVCARISTGQVQATIPVAQQQLYVPHDFVAFGGNQPRITHITTQKAGLRVTHWLVSTRRRP